MKLELTNLDISKVKRPWTQKTGSVTEGAAAFLVQFLKPVERIHFANELYRVLKPAAKFQIITPHWASNRAYSDMSFEWPPVVEQWYFHLNKDWRKVNNPVEKRYKCDFDITFGYGLHQLIIPRPQEYQQHAVTFWKEAAQDLIVTVSKK
jgi:hypothetical protein